MSHSTPKLETLLDTLRQRFQVDFDDMDVDGTPLHVLSIRNMASLIGGLIASNAIRDPLRDLPLWAKVWPASFVLGRYVRRFEPEGKTLLEIGAGCGVTGCIASRYGFQSVCISDMVEDALLFAQANIVRNGLENIAHTRRIDVANPPKQLERFDMIVASEILYLEDIHRPLLKFVARHLTQGGKAVFCTDMSRRQPRFFKRAAQDFTIQENMVGVRSTPAKGKAERHVYAIHTMEHQ